MPSFKTRDKSFLAVLNDLFERKTIKAFAYQVNAFEDLDRALQDALRPYLAPDDLIQMILFAPAQSVLGVRQPGDWRPSFLLPWDITPEHLLILTSQKLVVASLPRQAGQNHEVRLAGERITPAPYPLGHPPVVFSIPFTDILGLEAGSILLSSWIEITWDAGSHLERTRIHYNTVGRSLFEELVHRVRQQLSPLNVPASSPARPAHQGLERLEEMPFKFKNLIPLRLLLPGELVQAAVFRPSIWEKKGLVFRRRMAPGMALVRTGGWLILAHEDLTQDENSYGLVAQFYPLRQLRCAELNQAAAGLELELAFSLHEVDFKLKLPFQAEARPALQSAFDKYM